MSTAPTQAVDASSWLDQLATDLAGLDAGHLRRRLTETELFGPTVRRNGSTLINLSSNDYLGLASHPHLRAVAIKAIEQSGICAASSRLVAGHSPVHARVEARFAAFKHAQAALLFPTGYMANLAVITALAGPGDVIYLDKLNHASLIDAARFSGAIVRVFPHLGYEKLERLLGRTPSPSGGEGRPAVSKVERGEGRGGERANPMVESRPPRHFIITDSVFSMDGDTADLPFLCDLAQQHGAILIVDEAHATGVLGSTGAGLCELQGVTDRVHVVVSTASKALGGLGGIVTAHQVIIETLVNRARPFIYTTAVPVVQAAAIGAALDVIRDEPERRKRLLELSQRVNAALPSGSSRWNLQSQISNHKSMPTPIIPLVVGTPERAISLAYHLESSGFLAPAIRPPTVPSGGSRVRLSLRADLTDDMIDQLIAALRSWH